MVSIGSMNVLNLGRLSFGEKTNCQSGQCSGKCDGPKLKPQIRDDSFIKSVFPQAGDPEDPLDAINDIPLDKVSEEELQEYVNDTTGEVKDPRFESQREAYREIIEEADEKRSCCKTPLKSDVVPE